MSSPTSSSTIVRSCTGRRLLGVLVGLALLLSSAALWAPAAEADSAVKARSIAFTIKGAGFGHGWGMSQYGAYGAARKGLTWKKILAFYYPGTTLGTMPSGTTIKVWITADNDHSLTVLPSAGLVVKDGSGHTFTVPTGTRYKAWRISRSGSGYRLAYLNAASSYVTVKTGLSSTTWAVHNKAKIVKVRMPSGTTREYRGSMQLVKRDSGARTVNKVSLEDYVKAVVPAEMPTSWAADAVRSQAVAARSYAVRIRDFTSYVGYDLCDTTSCQVYPGYAETRNGRRVVRETSGGNAATKATAGTIVTYQGKVALTQFASSNGGHTAQGDYAYLKPKADPYDGVVVSQAWTRTVTTGSIAKAWPSVGTVRSLQVISRDGDGRWGGRVEKIKIIGSKQTLTVSGTTFQYRFAMRSNLFSVAG